MACNKLITTHQGSTCPVRCNLLNEVDNYFVYGCTLVHSSRSLCNPSFTGIARAQRNQHFHSEADIGHVVTHPACDWCKPQYNTAPSAEKPFVRCQCTAMPWSCRRTAHCIIHAEANTGSNPLLPGVVDTGCTQAALTPDFKCRKKQLGLEAVIGQAQSRHHSEPTL